MAMVRFITINKIGVPADSDYLMHTAGPFFQDEESLGLFDLFQAPTYSLKIIDTAGIIRYHHDYLTVTTESALLEQEVDSLQP